MEPVVRVILEDSIRRDIRPEVSVTVAMISKWVLRHKSFLLELRFDVREF